MNRQEDGRAGNGSPDSRPGFLAGLGYGAVAGMLTALGAWVVLTCAFAVEMAVGDSLGSSGSMIFLVFAYIGTIVAAVAGLIAGGVIGGLLGATKSSVAAPWVAAVLSLLIGSWIFWDDVQGWAEGRDSTEENTVAIVTVLLFAAIGWLGGRWFTKKMRR